MLLTNSFTRDARVEREARTLAEAGHEVRVFCLAREGLPVEELRDGYAIERRKSPDWLGWTGPRRVVPLLRWYSRYEFLPRAASRWRPDVVHGHDIETLLPSGRLARALDVPHVYDDHELALDKLGQGTEDRLGGVRRLVNEVLLRRVLTRGKALERRLLPRAAGLITVNDLCADVIEQRYGRRPTVLMNVPWRSELPPDPRLRERAGLARGSRIALYQGMVTPVGGAEECIAAVREFPQAWYLTFLGVSWMRPILEERARSEGVEDRVRFLDRVPPAELPGFTRAADLGLSTGKPSNLSQKSSLANKVFEYMHAGIPMIVSDLPLQARLTREHDAGVVIPEVTPTAIAEAVRAIAAIPEADRRRDGARVRAIAEEKYCWEVEQGKLVDLYRRILGTG